MSGWQCRMISVYKALKLCGCSVFKAECECQNRDSDPIPKRDLDEGSFSARALRWAQRQCFQAVTNKMLQFRRVFTETLEMETPAWYATTSVKPIHESL